MFVMDLVTGIIGFVLILAPFIFNFYENSMATWVSIVIGMMLFFSSCRQAMKRFEFIEEDEIDGAEQQE
ncbi:MAG: SPW repeat protein [Patescibacteria group bacterium]